MMSVAAIAKQTGKKYSAESKTKMAAAKLGKKLNAAHVEKIRAALIGRPVSEKTRAKLAIAAIGNKRGLGCKRSLETRRKISQAAKRRGISQETQRKMRETKLRRSGLPSCAQA